MVTATGADILPTPRQLDVGAINVSSVAGGTLNATDDVVVPSLQTLSWNNNATITGAGALNTSGTTMLVGSPILDGKTWNNSGTVNWNSAGNLTMQNVSNLNNLSGGVFNLAGGFYTNPGISTVTNYSGGTFVKSA